MEGYIAMVRNTIYYPYLDVLKGIAILLMVMGHVIPWTLDEPFLQKPLGVLSGNELYLSLVYKIIYSFHMPLLFFVSGFLFYKPIKYDKENIRDIVYNRLKRILIPYFTTGTLLLISRGHWGYWFLQCLFFMDVVVVFTLYLVDHFKLSLRKELCLYFFIGILLYLLGKIGKDLEDYTYGIVVIGRLFNFYPAFLLGLLIRKYSRFKEFLTSKNVVFGCLILYMLTFVLKGMEIPIIGLLASVILPLTMVVYLYNLSLSKSNTSANEWGGVIALVGRNSMEVYIIHSFYIMVFKEVGAYMMTLNSLVTCITFQIVYSFILSVVAICLSILTADFLKGSVILKRLLFGL